MALSRRCEPLCSENLKRFETRQGVRQSGWLGQGERLAKFVQCHFEFHVGTCRGATGGMDSNS
jgi:hypothetical protein